MSGAGCLVKETSVVPIIKYAVTIKYDILAHFFRYRMPIRDINTINSGVSLNRFLSRADIRMK